MGEGKGYSDMYRNTSEEMYLKSLMESSIGMPDPTMEMLGFKNLSSHHNFRTDSEELFKSWLTNGENHGCSSSSIAHRTRQASRRISAELASFNNQQSEGSLQYKRSNDILSTQNNPMFEEGTFIQQAIRNAVEKNMQANNLYLAKAWFHSSHPMTRSRSSELRRRYVAMQNTHTTLGNSINHFKQDFVDQNALSDPPMHDVANQLGTLHESHSSSSPFDTSQIRDGDNISSIVSMLKGTLERKKLNNQSKKATIENSSNIIYHPQQILMNSSFDQVEANNVHEISQSYQERSSNGAGVIQTVEDPIDPKLEGFISPRNSIQISKEPSQSESSAVAPVVSSSFDACDGPSICKTSMNQTRNNQSTQNGHRARDIREQIIENLKDDRKRGNLGRHGSVTSTSSVDKVDTTKKRRVERSRKMAEAKERNSTPTIPSDMQSVLKRCENLEKEVRSLKLNLSFMNRKDSEQTNQIEELQKRNEELVDEKERLVDEIERILSESGRM